MEIVWGYLFIFFARIVDVSLGTFRTLMIVRGRRAPAALLGFFEVSVYILALGKVVTRLGQPSYIIAYALGFATGNWVGSLIEERVALGFLTVQAITRLSHQGLCENLRQAGFGVTSMHGEGRDGPREVLLISLRRRLLPRLVKMLEAHDPDVFITVLEARRPVGGVHPEFLR